MNVYIDDQNMVMQPDTHADIVFIGFSCLILIIILAVRIYRLARDRKRAVTMNKKAQNGSSNALSIVSIILCFCMVCFSLSEKSEQGFKAMMTECSRTVPMGTTQTCEVTYASWTDKVGIIGPLWGRAWGKNLASVLHKGPIAITITKKPMTKEYIRNHIA